MLDESKPGKACAEFDAMLIDALDGVLTGERKEGFDAHRRSCPICGPMFAEVEAGQLWLRSLEPVEPPPHLLHNILAATTGVVSTGLATSGRAAKAPWRERVREWWDSWFTPVTAFVRQPRFVMSFGMIFFTSSLVMSTSGVKASDVAKIDLRPSALRHTYNSAQIKIVQYYDNIRFVYEVESKVRELKRATTPAEAAPEPKKQNRGNGDTSEQPEQRQDRNYSMEDDQTVLAALRGSGTVTLEQAASSEPRARGPQAAGFSVAGEGAAIELLFARNSRLATPGSRRFL
jgi:hypothetical protein